MFLWQSTSEAIIYSMLSTYGYIFVQVGQYITEGLDRAKDSLTEAAALREKFILGASVSRRVAAASAVIIFTFLKMIFSYLRCSCVCLNFICTELY